jgi:cyclic pyranopterin phosphate synthase
LNDDEVVDFARLTLTGEWHIRYIEVMPLGQGANWSGDGYVPSHVVRARIEEVLGPLQPADLLGNGPARYWRLAGAPGTIGFISPISEHFCDQCNRLRLTADGRLLPCLFGEAEIELRAPLRQGASDDELRALLLQAIAAKPAGHRLGERIAPQGRLMSQTGG